MTAGVARLRYPSVGLLLSAAVTIFLGYDRKVTEGVVTHIDRGRKQITVRFDNTKTETFRLTDRAALEATKDIDQVGTSDEGCHLLLGMRWVERWPSSL